MKILILSQWYPPEPVAIPHEMACDLVKRGHQVLSITGFPNYPSGRIYPGYRQRLWQWEEMDGVQVLRLPLYPYHGRSGALRAVNFLSFAVSASLLSPLLYGSVDIIYVYHPPLTMGLPAWVIGLLRRVPFVYDIKDMWPETLRATSMTQSNMVCSILDGLAKFIYSRAAAIVVPSPGFKRNLVTKKVSADKIYIIPNWADEKLYQPMPSDPVLAIEYGLAGRFNIIYAGNIGLAQGLDTVIEAAQYLDDLPNVQFVLIGDGVDEPRLRQRVTAHKIKNVRFLGRQPAERMPYFFALADVLLVHLKHDPLFEITIPSKTLAYMACGRPILMAAAGDAADVVRDAGAGLICAPQDPQALADTVRTFYAMPAIERERMGQSGREAFLKHYTKRTLMDQYEALFTEIVYSRKGGQPI